MIIAESHESKKFRDFVAPFRQAACPWAGHEPWTRHAVEVAIPVINPKDTLPHVLELLRLQTVRPYIVLIDTGSNEEEYYWLDSLQSDDIEVHHLNSGGQRHPSAIVSVALDLATAVCRAEKLVLTHQDCFVTSRDSIERLVAQVTPEYPVVGYRISPRPEEQVPDWRQMIGHTWSALHIPTLRDLGISWSFNEHPESGHHDTEYEFCRRLLARQLPPKLIGEENNYVRTINEDFDHIRSWPSSNLYARHYADSVEYRVIDALAKAEERITRWKREAAETQVS